MRLFEEAARIRDTAKRMYPPDTQLIAVYKLPESYKPKGRTAAKPLVTAAKLHATILIHTVQGRRKAFLYRVTRKREKLEDYIK